METLFRRIREMGCFDYALAVLHHLFSSRRRKHAASIQMECDEGVVGKVTYNSISKTVIVGVRYRNGYRLTQNHLPKTNNCLGKVRLQIVCCYRLLGKKILRQRAYARRQKPFNV